MCKLKHGCCRLTVVASGCVCVTPYGGHFSLWQAITFSLENERAFSLVHLHRTTSQVTCKSFLLHIGRIADCVERHSEKIYNIDVIIIKYEFFDSFQKSLLVSNNYISFI